MRLTNIIALCMFVACTMAAGDDKKEEKKDDSTNATEVITAKATAKDIKDADCAKLTVKALNALEDPKACAGLTASCAKQFNMSNVGAKCLANMDKAEWKKMDDKTIMELMSSKAENLSFTKEQLTVILGKIKMDDTLPKGFTNYVARSTVLMSVILGTSSEQVFKSFLTAPNIAAMDPSLFRRFGSGTFEVLADDALSMMNGNQLTMVPAASFKGIRAAQFAKIPCATLASLTKEQASQMSKECWNGMTTDQIKSFGPSMASAPKLTAQDATKKEYEILARRQLVENHPCKAVEGIKDQLTDEKKKALEAQCKPVEAFSVNSGSMLTVSLVATGAMMAAALVPAFLF